MLWVFLKDKAKEYFTGKAVNDPSLGDKVADFFGGDYHEKMAKHDAYSNAKAMLDALPAFGTGNLRTLLAAVVKEDAHSDVPLKAITEHGNKIADLDKEWKAGGLDKFLAAALKAANDGQGISEVAKEVSGVTLADGADAKFALEMLAPSAYPATAGVVCDDAQYAVYCLGIAKAIFENATGVVEVC